MKLESYIYVSSTERLHVQHADVAVNSRLLSNRCGFIWCIISNVDLWQFCNSKCTLTHAGADDVLTHRQDIIINNLLQ